MNGQQLVHAMQQQVPTALCLLGLHEEERVAHHEFDPAPVDRARIELNGVPELLMGREHLEPDCDLKITFLEAFCLRSSHG